MDKEHNLDLINQNDLSLEIIKDSSEHISERIRQCHHLLISDIYENLDDLLKFPEID